MYKSYISKNGTFDCDSYNAMAIETYSHTFMKNSAIVMNHDSELHVGVYDSYDIENGNVCEATVSRCLRNLDKKYIVDYMLYSKKNNRLIGFIIHEHE